MNEPLRIKDTVLLEDLGDDGDGRVNGVGDDKDERLWRALRDTGGEVADDACVDLDEMRRVSLH